MPNKSLLRITQPRETYIDGYGVERTFDEPKVITKGRKVWDAGKNILDFLEGDKTWTAPDGQQYPITQGAGVFEVLDPNPAGKLDDVVKLTKNLDNVKDTYRKAMLNIKNRRRAFWHELDMANKNKRVGGMNYAVDLMDDLTGAGRTVVRRPAAEYNAAKKAGDVRRAEKARREVEILERRDFYDPYVNNSYWERIDYILNHPYNGGPRKNITPPTPNYIQPRDLDELPW